MVTITLYSSKSLLVSGNTATQRSKNHEQLGNQTAFEQANSLARLSKVSVPGLQVQASRSALTKEVGLETVMDVYNNQFRI